MEGQVTIEAKRIRDNLHLLRGGGRTVSIGGVALPSAGNSLALIGKSGVVLVDSKLPGCGKPILDKIREITARPVTTIINTHTHFDHDDFVKTWKLPARILEQGYVDTTHLRPIRPDVEVIWNEAESRG